MANINVSYPSLETPTKITTVQDNRVLPRNIFTSGNLPGTTVIRVGENNVVIDAANRQIKVNDGTNDRVLIGRF